MTARYAMFTFKIYLEGIIATQSSSIILLATLLMANHFSKICALYAEMVPKYTCF